MPYADPAKRREFQASYQAAYTADNADTIRQRRAKWYQANKDRLREKERADYHRNRTQTAILTLQRLAK
jgi:hypothetical protein